MGAIICTSKYIIEHIFIPPVPNQSRVASIALLWKVMPREMQ